MTDLHSQVPVCNVLRGPGTEKNPMMYREDSEVPRGGRGIILLLKQSVKEKKMSHKSVFSKIPRINLSKKEIWSLDGYTLLSVSVLP